MTAIKISRLNQCSSRIFYVNPSLLHATARREDRQGAHEWSHSRKECLSLIRHGWKSDLEVHDVTIWMGQKKSHQLQRS